MCLKIEDSTEPLPRARRDGLDIRPELRTAVKDALNTGKTKIVKVTNEEQAKNVLAQLRSLCNREGYQITKRVIRDDHKNPVGVGFETTNTGRTK